MCHTIQPTPLSPVGIWREIKWIKGFLKMFHYVLKFSPQLLLGSVELQVGAFVLNVMILHFQWRSDGVQILLERKNQFMPGKVDPKNK